MSFKFSLLEKDTVGASGRLKVAIKRGFVLSAKLLQKELRRQMAEKKSGRRYKVYVGAGGKRLARGRFHIASASNETSGKVTGRFARSVAYKLFGTSRLEFGSNLDYAFYQEHGTKRMAARANFDRITTELDPRVRQLVSHEVTAFLKGKKG